MNYLNTVPLVWGMLHGPQRGRFDLEFQVPSVCADRLAAGLADIGIVPAFELSRQQLKILPGAGIACHGAVRSILLVSRRRPAEIATVAVDSSSRTSVQLVRVILERRYGASPRLIPHPPDLPEMLRTADAALIIGDPALRVDPADLPYRVLDLGSEWVEMTGYPMVFAVWAGREEFVTPETERLFRESCRFGQEHLEEIVAVEAAGRGFSEQLAREYLMRHVVLELGAREYEGLDLFLRYAQEAAAGEGAAEAEPSGRRV